MRQDYCPIANEPCQSMCETPCNRKEILAIRKDAERWRTFLAIRPPETHDVINQAIDAAMQKGKT